MWLKTRNALSVFNSANCFHPLYIHCLDKVNYAWGKGPKSITKASAQNPHRGWLGDLAPFIEKIDQGVKKQGWNSFGKKFPTAPKVNREVVVGHSMILSWRLYFGERMSNISLPKPWKYFTCSGLNKIKFISING